MSDGSKPFMVTSMLEANRYQLDRMDGYNLNTLVRQIAGALALAHSVGIGHYNLKPQNILLGHSNGGLNIYVSDYMNYIQPPEMLLKYLGRHDLSYIDPLQLIDPLGRPDPRYDVYSYASIMMLLHEHKHSLCIRAVNMALALQLYGIEYDMNINGQALSVYKSLLKMIESAKPERALSRINRDYKSCIGNEMHTITGGLRKLLMQSLSLNREDRPRTMIDVALTVRAI